MMFDVKDEGSLKKWIIKRLEDVSDADSDVLADYVLALLRHDSPQAELRKLCIEQLEDFLKEHTPKFVDDTLVAVANKSYIPGALPSSTSTGLVGIDAPKGPAAGPHGHAGRGGYLGAQNGSQGLSRKRAFNHDGDDPSGRDSHYGRNAGSERAIKQPRRGGLNNRGGMYDSFGNRVGRPDAGRGKGPMVPGGLAQPPQLGMPGMPPGAPGFPFDPNNPMMAMQAMQAMGFPPLPGMPPFPQPGSPTAGFGQSARGGHASPPNGRPKNVAKINERCKDYDQKGFCALGGNCPYEHGTDHITVPTEGDEYDPTKSAIMTDAPALSPTAANGSNPFQNQRGGRGRGRGRGRGDGSRGGGGESIPRRNRAEFSAPGSNQDRSITTVVVESIPEDKFNEQTVRDFFSSFGTIAEVTMQAYKRLALVKYEDWASAKRAWESPKVIFDNRFVKVYWFKPNSNPKPPGGSESNGFAREGSAQAPPKTAEEIEQEMEEIKKKQEELQRAHEEKMKKIKETEESKKELEKRRLALLSSQAEETRKLKERLAAKMGATTDGGSPAAGVVGAADDKSMSDAPSGADGTEKTPTSQTEALKAQLAALEAKASSMGIDYSLTEESPFPPRGRGRGGYRGRSVRGAYPSSTRGRGGYDPARGGGYRGRGGAARGGGSAYKLDNRTKKVAITGVDLSDESKDEGLRQYLLGLGEYTSIEASPDKPNSQVVTFKDRFTAEKFIYGTTDIPSVGKVEFAWINTPLPPVTPAYPLPGTSATAEGSNNSGDVTMATTDAVSSSNGGAKPALNPHEDYDIADEDEDRWIT